MPPAKFGFGQPVRRKEDQAFLRGSGRYVADFAPADLCHAAVLRSPHAHARFRISDIAAARTLPGVRLVLTAEDIPELGSLPCMASVVADTLDEAQDATEAIAVEWQALPCVVDGRAALADGAPRMASDRPGNLVYEISIGDAKETRQACAAARRCVSLELVNQRVVANYLDTRGVIG